MGALEDLTKLPVGYLLLGIALFLPGLGYIYLARYNLFLNLEILKLILLSFFYSFPLVVINLIYATYILNEAEKIKKVKDIVIAIIGTGSLFTLIGVFFSFIIIFTLRLFELCLVELSLIICACSLIVDNIILIWFKKYTKLKLKKKH